MYVIIFTFITTSKSATQLANNIIPLQLGGRGWMAVAVCCLAAVNAPDIDLNFVSFRESVADRSGVSAA